MVLAAPRDHWTVDNTAISLAELAEEPWVLPDPKVLPGYAAQLEGILLKHSVTLDRVTRTGHQNRLCQMTAAGRGFGLNTADIAASANGHGLHPVPSSSTNHATRLPPPPHA